MALFRRTLLVSLAFALGLRGIPVFVWIIAYLFSAFVAPTIWKVKQDVTPAIWFLSAVLSGGLTALLYLIGVRLLGPTGQPWLVFRIPGILAPMAALISISSFARALYVAKRRQGWSHRSNVGANPQRKLANDSSRLPRHAKTVILV